MRLDYPSVLVPAQRNPKLSWVKRDVAVARPDVEDQVLVHVQAFAVLSDCRCNWTRKSHLISSSTAYLQTPSSSCVNRLLLCGPVVVRACEWFCPSPPMNLYKVQVFQRHWWIWLCSNGRYCTGEGKWFNGSRITVVWRTFQFTCIYKQRFWLNNFYDICIPFLQDMASLYYIQQFCPWVLPSKLDKFDCTSQCTSHCSWIVHSLKHTWFFFPRNPWWHKWMQPIMLMQSILQLLSFEFVVCWMFFT